MSKSSKIRIDEAEIEVFLSTKAMMDIKGEMNKPFDQLREWMTEEGLDIADTLVRVSHVIGHLANGAVFRHNSQIKAGLIQGEPRQFYDLDLFVDILDPFQMKYYFTAIFECIYHGNVVSVPEQLKFTEEDEVLKELEEEKNQTAGGAETTCSSSTEA
jgi:hypothetical protein